MTKRPAEAGRRRRWTDDERRQILANLDASGLSVLEFSKRVGINFTCLYDWRRRIGREPGLRATARSALKGVAHERFTPVEIVESRASNPAPPRVAAAIEIAHRSGWTIRVASEFDAEHLRRVISLVAEQC